MPSVYRIDRTLASGWRVRLEIVPYDAQLGDARVAIDGVALLELGPTIAAFDELPFGLMNAGTQSLRLLWNNLPSALKSYLKNGYDSVTGNRNTWMLFSDRGTSGATYTLEFAGTEDNIEALELEPLGDGQYAYSTELVDLVYYGIKTMKAADVYGDTPLPDRIATRLYVRREFGSPTPGKDQVYDLSALGFQAQMKNINWMTSEVTSSMNTLTWPKLVRTSATPVTGTNIANVPYAACKLYAVDSLAYVINTDQLPKTTPVTAAYIVSAIFKGIDKLGGLTSTADRYSLCANTESAYDVLRQLCETFGVKVTYTMAYVGTVGAENITVTWNVETVLQGRGKASNDDTSNVTLSLDDAISTGALVIRGENILKAEARYETESENDVTELAKLVNGSRGSRSYNVEMRTHNNTIRLRSPKQSGFAYAANMEATNLIWLLGTDNYSTPVEATAVDFVIAPHSKTRYVYGPAANDYVQSPDLTTFTEKWLVDMTGINNNLDTVQRYLTWLSSWQLNSGMPATWCALMLTLFANEDNARLTATWPFGISAFVLPSNLGSRHTLTGDMATTFDNVVFTQAIVTEVSFDWNAGTSEVTYQIIAA